MSNFYDRKAAQAGPGQVWACPWCGKRLLVHCHHDGIDVQAELMTEAEADDLKENSGLYEARLYECGVCGEEKELAPGAMIGGSGVTCADCSGAPERPAAEGPA